MNHTKIGIYIYDEAEVLDFSGPFEVFSTASRICKNEDPFEVFLIGETGENIHARGGYEVCPKYGFRDDPELDVLIVVGGVHDGEMNKPQVIEWIRQKAESFPRCLGLHGRISSREGGSFNHRKSHNPLG